MSEPREIRSLVIEREGQASIVGFQEAPLADGRFRTETLYTGLSAGTELTFFKGTNPYLHASWDEQFSVFREGKPSFRFPLKNLLGYMEVGRVSESRTPLVQEGEIVAMAYTHKTGHTANPLHEFFMPLPGDLDPVLGIYVARMGPVCANGLLYAAADLMGQSVRDLGDGVRGRNVLVTGAGVVGLLTGLFALHHGAASVAVADSTPWRLDVADRLGLIPIDENKIDAWRYCKEHWHNGPTYRGADVVFQCRGQISSLETALRSLRPEGTVIDLAFYQGGAPSLRLGEEFHHNSLTIRSAQIRRVPRGLAHAWSHKRLSLETIDLLRSHGSIVREHIISNIEPFDNAPRLIAELAARKRHVIQAVFRC